MASGAEQDPANQSRHFDAPPRDEKLDLVRGLSAILVLLGHIRGLIFHDLAEVKYATLFVKAGYFLTGLGHQAVMVFFVLSGYFVGGSVIQAVRKGRFRWSRYAAARLTRLWVVLLPALVLTAGLDHVGINSYPDFYLGQYHEAFRSGPSMSEPLKLDWKTFFGNLVFVQTIAVAPYGTNGPLWSLANEFWYYVLFPLAFVPCCSRLGQPTSLFRAVFSIAGLVVLCRWLPASILALGVVWLLGALVWRLTQFERMTRIFNDLRWNISCSLLFLGSLMASKTHSLFGTDYAVGVAFALWLPSLLGPWPRADWRRSISTRLSDISYTLYITHFPILFLLAAALLHGRQLEPDLFGCGVFFIFTAASLMAACCLWYLFEANTAIVRRALPIN